MTRKRATLDGKPAIITDIHQKNHTHFTVQSETEPKIGSKLEYVANNNAIYPYVVEIVDKTGDNQYRVVTRLARGLDYS